MGAFERGETNISLDNLDRIARALDVTAGQHLLEAEKERGKSDRQKGRSRFASWSLKECIDTVMVDPKTGRLT